MVKSIAWGDLLEVYLNARWLDGDDAEVALLTPNIVETFRSVEVSDKAASDANLAALNPQDIALGRTIRARISAPKYALGLFAETWDSFLSSEAKVKEPAAYFIKEDRSYAGMSNQSERLKHYKNMIAFLNLLGRAALFLDIQKQALVFFKERKIDIPVRFSASDLRSIDVDALATLTDILADNVHVEQKLEILADAVVTLASTETPENRFLYLAKNVDELARRIKDGYQLFVSSFSYAKIRGEVEAAQSAYVAQIHKTFVDIQGQLLGLPVASVVVATQIKAASTCGIEAWANVAVVIGAWLFAFLLVASCVNQWFTLGSIRSDVNRQKLKLSRDYSEISPQFSDVFSSLGTRIFWHRTAMFLIGLVAIGAAAFATIVFRSVTTINVFAACMK